jgi:histone arginine demethylase JMJD6
VGSGCHLLRRESQLPLIAESSTTTANQRWKQLKHELAQFTGKHISECNKCRRIPASSGATNTVHPWFERESIPVLLENLANDWPAYRHSMKWETLLQMYGDTEWRVSDTHGETISLRTYTKYIHGLEGQSDDAPLALYDSQFHLDERASLVQDYTVPKCFAYDLYAVLDDDVDRESEGSGLNDEQYTDSETNSVTVYRPPYRWILIGGERSGTGLHVDPVGTHAWVTLIEGCKRWVLFPPHVDRTAIGMQTPQVPSAIWFQKYYQQAMEVYGTDAIHVVQRPGETVYVPAGWPHIVLNLEPSVALTENYATAFPSMEAFWDAVKAEEPALARALQAKLRGATVYDESS